MATELFSRSWDPPRSTISATRSQSRASAFVISVILRKPLWVSGIPPPPTSSPCSALASRSAAFRAASAALAAAGSALATACAACAARPFSPAIRSACASLSASQTRASSPRVVELDSALIVPVGIGIRAWTAARIAPCVGEASQDWRTEPAKDRAVRCQEIRRLLRGDLDPTRSREPMDEMRAAGLPT